MEEQCGSLGFKMKYQRGGYENISFFIDWVDWVKGSTVQNQSSVSNSTF